MELIKLSGLHEKYSVFPGKDCYLKHWLTEANAGLKHDLIVVHHNVVTAGFAADEIADYYKVGSLSGWNICPVRSDGHTRTRSLPRQGFLSSLSHRGPIRKKWPSLASTGSMPQYHLEEESRKSPHFRVSRIPNLKRFTCEVKTFHSRLTISNSWHTPEYCYFKVHELQGEGLFGTLVPDGKPRCEGAGLACHVDHLIRAFSTIPGRDAFQKR